MFSRTITSVFIGFSLASCASADMGDEAADALPGSPIALMADVTCTDSPQEEALLQFEQSVVSLVNEKRAAGAVCGGVTLAPTSPVRIDQTLVCVARAHSRDMANAGYFDHTSLDGATPFDRLARAGYDFRAAAENVAMGQPDPERVVESWMESDGHCRNILSPMFEDMGVGVALDRKSRMVWTQVFATRY